MSEELWNMLEHPPVQVTCEAVKEDLSLKLYARLYISSDGKGRFDFESRLLENDETVDQGAYIFLPPSRYQVDLIAKTYKIIGGEIGFDFDTMGLRVIDVIHEEPDPHLFLITADLTPGENTSE